MPKLTLWLGDRVLQECLVGEHPVTIGRLADNLIVIDNPAVSARHARVFRDGDRFIVEDLTSTNGTFVREKPIVRQPLLDRDVVMVGKHALVFSMADGEQAGVNAPVRHVPDAGRITMRDIDSPRTTSPLGPMLVGEVRVVAGKTAQSRTEYTLAGITSIIGKADTAQIKLKGWFKPKVAAALARHGEGYTVTSMGAKTIVNGQVISGRKDLRDGDLIEVAGLTLEFHIKPANH
jgi:predicted component of type VI protein secretion system